MAIEIEYAEYATDLASQQAYVSSDTSLVLKYPPAHSDTYVKATSLQDANWQAYFATDPSKSLIDNAVSNAWLSSDLQNRFHIDLGVAYVLKGIYYENYCYNGAAQNNRGSKNFTLWGSNTAASFAELTYATDTGWTQLTTSQSYFDQHIGENIEDPKYITVTNSIAYRYYAIKIADDWGANDCVGFRRIVLQIQNLQCYSEPTIKTQGDNSLRIEAAITDSLNDTLTRTVSPTIDLTDKTQIKYDIRASRTGGNIKISVQDTGGTTSIHSANVVAVDTWQTETWDISGVSNANKDAIIKITVAILNADATNTFYLDNMFAITWRGRVIFIGDN